MPQTTASSTPLPKRNCFRRPLPNGSEKFLVHIQIIRCQHNCKQASSTSLFIARFIARPHKIADTSPSNVICKCSRHHPFSPGLFLRPLQNDSARNVLQISRTQRTCVNIHVTKDLSKEGVPKDRLHPFSTFPKAVQGSFNGLFQDRS
jgi:hypothetical protein